MVTPKLGGRPITKIKGMVEERMIEDKQDHLKTLFMIRLENKHGRSIQRLLREGSGVQVATTLNVTESCVSRWRARFEIGVVYRGTMN
jgi:predicted aconitase